MRRVLLRAVIASVVASGLLCLGAHAASAAVVTSSGSMSFSVQSFDPCSLQCASGFSGGAFAGVASGLDVNGHPFTAEWHGTSNLDGSMWYTTTCDMNPTAEFIAGGSFGLEVTGGTLIDNGVTLTNARLDIGMSFHQYGTAVEADTGVAVYTADGTLVASPQLLGAPGAGQVVPVWSGNQVPMDCYEQWLATLHFAITYTGNL